MGYIYTFDIGSILFFSLTIYFYSRQRRVRDLSDQIYFTMLMCGMVALVFDCSAGMMEYAAMQHPVWLLYTVNMLFIVAMQACLPLFFIYVCVLTGLHYRISRAQHALLLVPYLITMLLLALSPFGTFGVCYIDSAHIYRPGAMHLALYVNTAIYIIGSITLLLKNYRSIQRAKRIVLLLFVLLLFIAIALQLLFPRYLLTASATALALTAMFYVLQSPVDRINPYTGAVSRMLLPSLLMDYHGRRRPYTLVLFSLHSFDEIAHLYGNHRSDLLLKELTKLLQSTFPSDTVIYMDTWEFTVLCDRLLSEADVSRMTLSLPESLLVDGVEIPIPLYFSAVPFDSAFDAASTLCAADYLLRETRLAPKEGVLYADRACRARCAALLRLESSLDDILANGVPALRFSPIVCADGTVAAEDVALHFEHPAMSDVPYPQFLLALAQGGFVWMYYRMLFSLLAPDAGRYSAARPACVPLSAAACIQDDAAARLYDIVVQAGFLPESIHFCMRESDVAASLPALHDTVRRLAAFGFGFRLDAFAAGLTDLSKLTDLPVTAVKLDHSLVHNARLGAQQRSLLRGMLQILHDLNNNPSARAWTARTISRARSTRARRFCKAPARSHAATRRGRLPIGVAHGYTQDPNPLPPANYPFRDRIARVRTPFCCHNQPAKRALSKPAPKIKTPFAEILRIIA